LKNLRPSRQVQQSITPRQGDFPVDVLAPLYRPEDSPPLATRGTIRSNNVPALPGEDNVWSSAVFREAQNKLVKEEDLNSLANYAGSGILPVFGKLDVKGKKHSDNENKNAAQSESPPSVLSSTSPVVSEVSNNSSQSLNSKTAEDIMVTTEEDPDLESSPMSKPPEPSKKEDNAHVVTGVSNNNSTRGTDTMVTTEEDSNSESKPISKRPEPTRKKVEELKIELADTLEELSLVTMQLAKEQEVLVALKTKFSPQLESPNKCQSCIDRLKAFDSCKNCVNSRGNFSRRREIRKNVNFGIIK